MHGGVWVGGRHTRGAGFIADRERMNWAALNGWIVIETVPEHIKSGQAVDWLRQALEGRGWNG